MNEYILFDPGLRDQFLAFLTARGLQHSVRPDPIEGFVVRLTDEPTDEIETEIEEYYAALMTQQRDLTEADADARSLMAVEVTLADGRPLSVHLPALYARRLHEHFSIDEIRALVALIAQSTIDPPDGPLCCRN